MPFQENGQGSGIFGIGYYCTFKFLPKVQWNPWPFLNSLLG